MKMNRSQIMSRIRSKDTAMEVSVRRFLWRRGFRYRKHWGPGKIDIAFPKQKVAIFLDNCFWHKCPRHCKMPKKNREFWKAKLKGNRKRDKLITKMLKRKGWKVLRIWEHALEKRDSLTNLSVKLDILLQRNSKDCRVFRTIGRNTGLVKTARLSKYRTVADMNDWGKRLPSMWWKRLLKD